MSRERVDWSQVAEDELATERPRRSSRRRRGAGPTAQAFRDQYQASKPRPRMSAVPALVLLALVLAFGFLVPRWLGGPALGVDDNQPEPPAQGRPAPAATPSSTAPTTSAPGPDDQAENAEVNPEPGALATGSAFVSAWLNRDDGARRQGLEESTTPALTGALMDTAPHNIWTASPAGAPEWLRGSEFRADLRQRMTDGRALIMVVERRPEAPHGWLVTSIAEGKR